MSQTPDKTGSFAAPDLERQRIESQYGQVYTPKPPARPGNARPLGLLGFGTSIFLVSLFGLQPRGISHSNLIVPELILFGGLCQFISGVVEFVAGDTFGATVFSSYGALTAAYGLIFVPGMGVTAAYTNPTTEALSGEFNQAVALFFWAWAIVTTIFLVGSVRSSWVLVMLLVFADLTLVFLAVGEMTAVEPILTTASGLGIITAFLAYWAGASDLWADKVTCFRLPVGDLRKAQ